MLENGMTKPHWKKIGYDYGDIYECSECGLLWWLEAGTPKDNEMYYCPKCGKRMDDFIENSEMEIVRS